jgi:hypothetical protein
VLYNLLSLKTQCDAGDATAKKLVNYVQRLAIDVYFGGATTNRPINEVVAGIGARGIAVKQNAEELLGGAAWLPSSV